MWWFSKSLLVALILLILHSHFISSSVQPKCRPETRTALLNLTTSQSQWDFNNTADCCTWDGVSCDSETGHVISLSLVDLNATITSTSSLFSLIHLQSLSVQNYLSSDFYVEIGSDGFDTLTRNLTKLQEIYFYGVNMRSVPPGSLMNLSSSLIELEIKSCQLTGKLSQNSFHFPNLMELSLPENNLEGPIPPWIYALPNLKVLNLNNNVFGGKIGEFQTTSLYELSLVNNSLQGAIPRSLFRQMHISKLGLSSNHLSGTVESQDLSNFKNLTHLYLSNDNLSVTSNCTNCIFDNLSFVILSFCNLTEFPHFLRSSKYLVLLDLSYNQIKGIVPKWLNDLKDLQLLDLRSNSFFGPLPNFSSQLIFFSGSKNKFSGEIPSSIVNISSFVSVIDLSYNNLSGQIPPFIGNVENLLVLDLRSNKLSGPIPDSLFVEKTSLASLNLNGNQLEGQLPRSLVHCTELELLDLGNNQFNDTFPDWLDSLPHLQILVLRGNKFHGSIRNPNPFQRNPIFPFQELRIMDLSHNDFIGALPAKYFDNFNAMKIDTSHDQLGYVGDEITRTLLSFYPESVRVTVKGIDLDMERIQTIFTTIDLSSNKFIGEIPELLGNLKSLKGLNLSHNMLTGILPPSLGHLTNLEWLDLSFNELVGNIPTQFLDINGLQSFDVSYNRLEGPIPAGKQFNTFKIDSFVGNSDLCGFPLPKSCGRGATEPPEPRLDQDEDGEESIIRFGSNWSIVLMGYASGLVIGISMGYMLLSSKGKLHWLPGRILEEIECRRAMRPKRRHGRRSLGN